MRSYKSDLKSFHWAEISSLTGWLIVDLITNTWLTTFTYYRWWSSQSLSKVQSTQKLPLSTLNYPTTVGNKELFTLSQLDLWIMKKIALKAASHCKQGGSFHTLMIHSVTPSTSGKAVTLETVKQHTNTGPTELLQTKLTLIVMSTASFSCRVRSAVCYLSPSTDKWCSHTL